LYGSSKLLLYFSNYCVLHVLQSFILADSASRISLLAMAEFSFLGKGMSWYEVKFWSCSRFWSDL